MYFRKLNCFQLKNIMSISQREKIYENENRGHMRHCFAVLFFFEWLIDIAIIILLRRNTNKAIEETVRVLFSS